MNKEIKARWLEALRSGKYEQGTTYLKNGDKYCCLGVLCDVVGVEPELLSERSTRSAFEGEENVYLFDGSKSFLSPRIANDVDLRTMGEFRRVVEYKGQEFDSLVQMNDRGLSFAEIADVIEQQL
jgi:hypothetical protein